MLQLSCSRKGHGMPIAKLQIGGFFDLLKRRAAAGGMELPESRRGPFDGVVKALHNRSRRSAGMASTMCARCKASNSLTGTSWRQHAPQPARQEIVLPLSAAQDSDILTTGVRQRQQNRKQFAGLQ